MFLFSLHFLLHLFFPFFLLFFSSLPFSPRVDFGRSKRSKHVEKHHPLSSLLGQSSNLFVKNKRKCESNLNEISSTVGPWTRSGGRVLSVSFAGYHSLCLGFLFSQQCAFSSGLKGWAGLLYFCTASHHEDPKAVVNRRRVSECSFAAFAKMKAVFLFPWNVACFGCNWWRSES